MEKRAGMDLVREYMFIYDERACEYVPRSGVTGWPWVRTDLQISDKMAKMLKFFKAYMDAVSSRKESGSSGEKYA